MITPSKTSLPSCLLACFLVCVLSPEIFAKVSLPEMGVPSHDIISPKDEKRLGRAFMQAVRMQVPIFDDQASLAYLQTLGTQLTTHAKPQHVFSFFIVNDPSINAFAGPGGYVGINTGLFTTSENESELAAVLAHEITHVTQRHIARGIEHAQESTWPSVGAIVAALLLGGKMDTAVTSGAILTAAAGKMQHAINYTRRFEHEADRIGMRVLYDSGFDPTAMPRFFGRMQQRTLGFSDRRMKLLRTHPVTEDRIADSQNRAQFYEKKPKQLNRSYPLIKARIAVLTAPARHDILRAFKKQWQQEPESTAAAYGYALALIRNHQAQKAEPLLASLVFDNPDEPIFALSLAESQQDIAPMKAQVTLSEALKRFPSYNPLSLAYAENLLNNGDPAKTIDVLQPIKQANLNNATYYLLLSHAQGRRNQLIDAYQNRAKAYILYNDLGGASMQLQQALALIEDKPKLTHELKKEIGWLQHEIQAMSDL